LVQERQRRLEISLTQLFIGTNSLSGLWENKWLFLTKGFVVTNKNLIFVSLLRNKRKFQELLQPLQSIL